MSDLVVPVAARVLLISALAWGGAAAFSAGVAGQHHPVPGATRSAGAAARPAATAAATPSLGDGFGWG